MVNCLPDDPLNINKANLNLNPTGLNINKANLDPNLTGLNQLLPIGSIVNHNLTGLNQFLPSADALEEVGVKFLDALIKKGQLEMAKRAFKTQMDVLKKVQPDQYRAYKRIPVERMAADAMHQQASMARMQPRSGNRLIDMLHENGIPIGNSIRGIEQAINTQKQIEQSDPAEQIAKAVFDKFQKQILPGLVANIIAGRNPFEVAQQRLSWDQNNQGDTKTQGRIAAQRMEENMKKIQADNLKQIPKVQQRQFDLNPLLINKLAKVNDESDEATEAIEDESKRNGRRSKRDSPVLSSSARGRSLSDRHQPALLKDPKMALLLGLNTVDSDWTDTETEQEHRRRAPPSPSHSPRELLVKLKKSRRLIKLLSHPEIAHLLDDPEMLLETKKLLVNEAPQQGFVTPRPLPKLPRIMLPLIVGRNEQEEEEEKEKETKPKSPFDRRRHPIKRKEEDGHRVSRVIANLKKNPGLAAIFEDGQLEHKLNPLAELLSDDQRLSRYTHKTNKIISYPRRMMMSGTKTHSISDTISQVKQVIEERPIPPFAMQPKGRHTRVRLTGAMEKDVPGIGTRFIMPSLDPAMPAVNSVMQTQAKQRDAYDSTLRIPNNWQPGDTFGAKMAMRSERLMGGDGGMGMPAMGLEMLGG